MVQMVRSFIRQEFMRSVLARLAGVIVMPVLYAFRKRLDRAASTARLCSD